MDTKKVIKKALIGCDRLEVAKIMEIHVGSLNNQVAGELPYKPKGKTQNFLDRVYNFIDATYEATGKMIALQALAEEFGFILIKNPTVFAAKSPVITKIAEIFKDFAGVVDEISKAVEDGIIEKHEAEKVRDRWEILKRQTEEFVLACETGSYDRKTHPLPLPGGEPGRDV